MVLYDQLRASTAAGPGAVITGAIEGQPTIMRRRFGRVTDAVMIVSLQSPKVSPSDARKLISSSMTWAGRSTRVGRRLHVYGAARPEFFVVLANPGTTIVVAYATRRILGGPDGELVHVRIVGWGAVVDGTAGATAVVCRGRASMCDAWLRAVTHSEGLPASGEGGYRFCTDAEYELEFAQPIRAGSEMNGGDERPVLR